MFEDRLEGLLENLFQDDDILNEDEIAVLRRGIQPSVTLSNCCTYNYTGYNG